MLGWQLNDQDDGEKPFGTVLIREPDGEMHLASWNGSEWDIGCKFIEDDEVTHWLPIPAVSEAAAKNRRV